jgi:hypothetical protein
MILSLRFRVKGVMDFESRIKALAFRGERKA